MTSYIVLQDWTVLGEASAGTPQAAIEEVLSKQASGLLEMVKDIGGDYVAVPSRSWNPMTVAPVTSLRFAATERSRT